MKIDLLLRKSSKRLGGLELVGQKYLHMQHVMVGQEIASAMVLLMSAVFTKYPGNKVPPSSQLNLRHNHFTFLDHPLCPKRCYEVLHTKTCRGYL